MPNFENAFNTVCELVKDFKENEHHFLCAEYNESQARKDFIDKLFIALGWDVNHTTQKNPYKQEVKVEVTQVNQRRPDYTFCLEPNFKEPKFFVEAKKPSKNLKDAEFYYQTIQYARFASTPIAVLTDFEEFHILDCRYKPNINSVLSNPNHKYIHYSDYANEEKFREIYHLFSRDDVVKNSLEEYADTLSSLKIRGVQTSAFKLEQQAPDEEFLIYLDDVRQYLAKAFKKNDSSLSGEELTEATQRTIDRLVFIRFLEDKQIEPVDYITKLGLSKNSWGDFVTLSKQLNSKYNGIVFKEHFIDSQKFNGPELSEFTNICLEFSQTNHNGFNYNLIPIHILGSIYERFLGKVVVATDKRVKVEEKPEVRKAGGVYYTPKYIVDYIVQNTIGKLIENKSPSEISKLRFADIACGSGSFLIGVFGTLLEYHNNYYWNHLDEAKKDGCLFKDNYPVLSIKQKQNILLNNIFGVDIDPQAIEVTQLSLALKMLEDETLATANDMQVLFHNQILPNLSKNIVCGNSLIGTDILDGKMFATEEERKLNPMEYDRRFPEIMKNGGFDVIVGNPPWGADLSNTKSYFKNNYKSNSTDSSAYFLEKVIKLSKGTIGYIVPKTISFYSSWQSIREFIIKNINIDSILDVGIAFPEVNLESIILILSHNTNDVTNIYECSPLKKAAIPKEIKYSGHFDKRIIKIGNIIPLISLSESETNIILKLNENNLKVKDVYQKIYRGLYIPDADKANLKEGKTEFINKVPDVQRYFIQKTMNIDISDNEQWIVKSKQIMVPRIFFKVLRGSRLICYPDIEGKYLTTEKLVNLVINNSKYPVSYLFLAGIFNSRISSFYIQKVLFSDTTETARVMDSDYMGQLIIPNVNLKNKSVKQSYDIIVSNVTQMLDAKDQLQSVKTDRDKTYYENKCADLDHAIDSEVYKLYGLTEEEIKIVEGK